MKTMLLRSGVIIAASALLVGGLAACSSPAAPEPTTDPATTGTEAPSAEGVCIPSGDTTIPMRLDFVHTGKDAIFTYGIEQGFFADNGITLTIEEGKGSMATGQTVGNGSDPIGIVDGSSTIMLAAGDVPITAVMSLFAQSALGVISRDGSGIEKPADLVGKRVAVTNGDGPTTLFPTLMKANDVDPASVNLMNMAPPAKLTSLLSDEVDAVATSGLVAATVEAQGEPRPNIMWYKDFGMNTPGWYIVTSNDYLKDNEGLVGCFVDATQKAVQATLDNPAAAVDSFVAKWPEYNKDQATNELALVLPLVPSLEADAKGMPLGFMSETLAAEAAAALQENGAFTKAPAVESFLTNQFIK